MRVGLSFYSFLFFGILTLSLVLQIYDGYLTIRWSKQSCDNYDFTSSLPNSLLGSKRIMYSESPEHEGVPLSLLLAECSYESNPDLAIELANQALRNFENNWHTILTYAKFQLLYNDDCSDFLNVLDNVLEDFPRHEAAETLKLHNLLCLDNNYYKVALSNSLVVSRADLLVVLDQIFYFCQNEVGSHVEEWCNSFTVSRDSVLVSYSANTKGKSSIYWIRDFEKTAVPHMDDLQIVNYIDVVHKSTINHVNKYLEKLCRTNEWGCEYLLNEIGKSFRLQKLAKLKGIKYSNQRKNFDYVADSLKADLLNVFSSVVCDEEMKIVKWFRFNECIY